MQRLKELYYKYYSHTANPECFELGKMPEVIKSEQELNNFFEKHMLGDEVLTEEKARFKIEELISGHMVATEMQGFVFGFRYGVQLMTECMPKAVTTSD